MIFERDSSFTSEISQGSVKSTSAEINGDIKVGPEINTEKLSKLDKPDKNMRRTLRNQRA